MKTCSVEGCGEGYYAKGVCAKHYQAQRDERPGVACSTAGCPRKFYALGLCRTCYQREFSKRPEQVLRKSQNSAKYRGQDKGRAKEFRNRLRKKGFTEASFSTCLARQSEACGICRAPFSAYKIQCDHDHVSGRARGLLCNPCNVGLGMYEKHQRVNGLRITQYEHYLTDPPAR